ncbi:TRIM2_3 [Mytilus edulis]|uniref:TRIM2_3 n=1 Tax=Mytilus edulis TaxID=6550 RepID=A0A8S3SUC8_MYTED|nr:TRIM2_3 [Mytilus edulis]
MKTKSLDQLELAWKVDPVLETILTNLKNFGSIEMKTQTSSLEFIRAKDKQAQLQVTTAKNTFDDGKLILQKKIKTDGKGVRGCCISEEGDLLITDCFYKQTLLTVFASDNKIKYKMPLYPDWAYDITTIDEKTVAITVGESRDQVGIVIIDIKNRRTIKVIKHPGSPWGITRDHYSLFVCVQGSGIYKISISDYSTKRVISCDLPTDTYVSVFTGNIYYTNYKDHSIVCCDQNGSRLWTFKDELVVNEPEGIAIDSNGHVYVVGEKSSNVVIISSDGKHHKQILSKHDGLSTPSAIFLDKENKKLLVANTQNTAFVYNILRQ